MLTAKRKTVGMIKMKSQNQQEGANQGDKKEELRRP